MPAHRSTASKASLKRNGLRADGVRESILRPMVKADRRIFDWKPSSKSPSFHLAVSHISSGFEDAICSSLAPKTVGPYGSGLASFAQFCDIHSISESSRFPASASLLLSFFVWLCQDQSRLSAEEKLFFPHPPRTVKTANGYLYGVRWFHVANGAPWALDDPAARNVRALLKSGLARICPNKGKEDRPPISIWHLRALKATLDLTKSFDATVWAVALVGVMGVCRMGELLLDSSKSFDPRINISRKDLIYGADRFGTRFYHGVLPSAKTMKDPRAKQWFSLQAVEERDLDPVAAMSNFLIINDFPVDSFLFTYSDRHNKPRPMTRWAFTQACNKAWENCGMGSPSGHSFRIGGACYWLERGVSIDDLRWKGRWESLTWKRYARAVHFLLPARFAFSKARSERIG